MFNKIVADNSYEPEFASFLDGRADIVLFVENSQSTAFRIESGNANGCIANYVSDFIVKRSEAEIWIIETEGQEDVDNPVKWERRRQWCADAAEHDGKRSFYALFARQEGWDAHWPNNFGQVTVAFE